MKQCCLWIGLFVLVGMPQGFAKSVPGDEPPSNYFPGFGKKRLSAGAVSAVKEGQPIIWIVIDALRPDHMGAYGYRRATTPALDQLAKEGVTFTRFYANAPWTRPATTTMLTGVIPSRHRVQCDWHKLPQDVGTIAQQLKKAGYTTLAVVGNGNVSSAFGMDKGFDVYEDTLKNWKGLPNAKQVIDLGLRHLAKHKRNNKVFLLLFVLDPHDPYKPKPPYDNMFMPNYKGKVRHRAHWEYKNNYPEPERRKMVALYDGLIRYTDDQLKVMFRRLKKMGIYKKASIFVTADHGEAFGEHGLYLHAHHHYETHIRIPLVVRAPWLRGKGRYSAALLSQIDLGATFVQLAGADRLPSMRGVSIVDALRDPKNLPVPRYLVSEYRCYGIKRSAIRTRRYKLVYQEPADREVFSQHIKDPKLLPSVSFDQEVFHLFDVLKDPHEKKNLWSSLKDTVGKKLLAVLKYEITQRSESVNVKNLDPELVEQLRSLGYMH